MTAADPEVTVRQHKTQKPKKGIAGDQRIPRRQSNGYYADHETGDRLRSVTTILSGGVPKEALIFWAANTCVDAAIEALPKLVAASRSSARLEDMRTWLKRAHTRKKDERADVGTAVHTIIEAHVLGEPLPETIVAGEGETAQTLRLDGPELGPYLHHFERFVEDWQVEFTASEMVVANPEHLYAGTLDYIVRSPLIAKALRAQGFDVADDAEIMGDSKTGGTLNRILSSGHVHGVYPEAGLQMSAYRKGTVCWLRNGDRVAMPPTAEVGIVLHLQPDGYSVYPTRCGDDIYRFFRHAQVVDEWTSKVSSAKAPQPVIGEALALPAQQAKAVA